MRHGSRAALCVLLLILTAGGCLRREITYNITKEGSCTVHFLASGDKNDLQSGDMLPSGPPWELKRYERKKPNGKTESCLEAVAEFAKVGDIPASFAPKGAPLATAYLQAPIEFKTWKEKRDSFYEFRQTYKARSWARYDDLLREEVGADLLELLRRYDFEHLTPDEQAAVLESLARWQMRIIYSHLELALQKTAAEQKLPKEAVRKTLRAAADYLDGLVTFDLVKKRMALPDKERAKLWENDLAKAREQVRKLVLTNLKVSPDSKTFRRFAELLDLAEKEYEVTNDLGDDSFVVKVCMPGIITDTNAKEHTQNVATWKFRGAEFRDKDYTIYVKSKLTE